MTKRELQQKIVIKALKDPVFKQKLIANPKEAVREFLKSKKVLDISLFDKINIRIVEEKKDEWVLTIPYLQAGMGTLTDAELEKTAGGYTTPDCDWDSYQQLGGGR